MNITSTIYTFDDIIGTIKPPIPTPRPKDIDMSHYKHTGFDDISSNSPTLCQGGNNIWESEGQTDGCENIYETLDFRGSLNIDSDHRHLPDILRDTKPMSRRLSEDIYECLEGYQVKYQLFICFYDTQRLY